MNKLAHIRSIVQEARELIEEFRTDAVAAIEEYNANLASLTTLQESIALTDVPRIKENLNSFTGLSEQMFTPIIECEDPDNLLVSADALESFEVVEPRRGAIAAKLWGVLAAIVLFVLLGIVGAILQHLMLDPSQMDAKQLLQSYAFYKQFLPGMNASPYIGVAMAALVSILFGILVSWVLLHKAAAANLAQAKALFDAAKEYVETNRPRVEHLKTLAAFLAEAKKNLEGLKILGEEYEARAKRIRFFEGNDAAALSERSRKELARLQKLFDKLDALSQVQLCKSDEDVAQAVRELFEEAGKLVEETKEEIYRG